MEDDINYEDLIYKWIKGKNSFESKSRSKMFSNEYAKYYLQDISKRREYEKKEELIKQQNTESIYKMIELIKNKNFYCKVDEYFDCITVSVRTLDNSLFLGEADFSKIHGEHKYKTAKEITVKMTLSVKENKISNEHLYSEGKLEYSEFDEFMKQLDELAVQDKLAQIKLKKIKATLDFV